MAPNCLLQMSWFVFLPHSIRPVRIYVVLKEKPSMSLQRTTLSGSMFFFIHIVFCLDLSFIVHIECELTLIRIARFTGQSEYVLNAEAVLTSMTTQKTWSRPPVSLNFSLLMFTSSGLLVRYLKVFEKSNYSSVKWVRYMTRAGSYEIRYPYPFPSWLY